MPSPRSNDAVLKKEIAGLGQPAYPAKMHEWLNRFYDQLYAAKPGIFGDSSRAWLERVSNVTPLGGGTALDIGAGEGGASRLLVALGYAVDAVDLSEVALSALRDERIRVHPVSITNFSFTHAYDLVHIALVAHHIPAEAFLSVVQKAQTHTNTEGIHVLRAFTRNSDFFRQSDGTTFFDDGVNLDAAYRGWTILADERITSNASAETATNEIRQVAFQAPK
jgi:SAM-dependent methyltransferase